MKKWDIRVVFILYIQHGKVGHLKQNRTQIFVNLNLIITFDKQTIIVAIALN